MTDKPNNQFNETESPKQRTCGTMQVHERLLRTNPDYVRARVASENYYLDFLQRRDAKGRLGVISIPVVVHVVFSTAQQNIANAQIQSQIDVLNRDFRRKNSDFSSVPVAFQPLAADTRIVFKLAALDPNGKPTNGITRTKTNKASFPAENDAVKSSVTGGTDPWPTDRYLNIWVAPRITSAIGDLLGYAQFPGGPAATDGVVILHTAFGTVGTAAAPFNLGRTATHEIGHWLNLRHIWGDDGNGCNGSDFVNDTPNQAGPHFGTPAFPQVTCNNGPNGDMFMNYMDYVDDASMLMFTVGQAERMRACLNGDRSEIGEPIITTIKFSDDGMTLKFSDDGGPVPTLKFDEDGGTLKFFEDGGSMKFQDDGGSNKFVDDVKQPGVGKRPVVDHSRFSTRDQLRVPQLDTSLALSSGGRAAPFVLSTPHHSMAWVRTFPQAARSAMSAYQQQIQQYEEALNAYAQADAQGQLGHKDQQQAIALYQEYHALIQEYQQLAASM